MSVIREFVISQFSVQSLSETIGGVSRFLLRFIICPTVLMRDIALYRLKWRSEASVFAQINFLRNQVAFFKISSDKLAIDRTNLIK